MPYTDKEAFGATEAKRIDDDVGFFESALAGVATGLWNIPKGFVSLGAEVFDLVGDTNTAAEVDKWFDEVNPFDDEAEARTVGKITQAITQIAPLAVTGYALGAKAGVKLARGMATKANVALKGSIGADRIAFKAQDIAKKAIAAKKAGKNFSLYNAGRKIMGPTTGGIIGGGIGEAVVTDEDIGTLADLARGTSFEPYALTMMDIEDKEGRADAYRRLKNRLKFGTEGALFNLGLIGVGKGIQRIRKPLEEGRAEWAASPVNKFFQKVTDGMSSIGSGGRRLFNLFRTGEDNLGAVKLESMEIVEEYNKVKKDLIGPIQDYQFSLMSKDPKFIGPSLETAVITEKEFAKDLFEATTVNTKVDPTFIGPVDAKAGLLKPGSKDRAIKEIDYQASIQESKSKAVAMENELKVIDDTLKDLEFKRSNNIITEVEYRQGMGINEKTGLSKLRKRRAELLNGKYGESASGVPKLLEPGLRQIEQNLKSSKIKSNIFKIDDYQINRKLEKIINLAKKAGVKDPEKIKDIVLKMRMSIDNMSSQLAQTGKLNKNALTAFRDDLGSYYSTQFEKFNTLIPFRKYKVNAEAFEKAKKILMEDDAKALRRDPKNYNLVLKDGKQIKQFDEELVSETALGTRAENKTEKYLSETGTDVADMTSPNFRSGADEAAGNKATRLEKEATLMEPSILTQRFAKPWQKALLGEIKDPDYNFYATVNKQAHLLSGIKFVDEVDKAFSVGPNKKIFTAEELKAAGKEAEMNDPNKWKKVKIESDESPLKGLSPLEGKYVQAPVYDEIFRVSNDWINKTDIGMMYRYMFLAPKAATQIAKTILSGTTHIRNFLSAAAFAAGNGAILPNLTDIQTLAPKALGGQGALGEAYTLTGKRLFGTISKAEKEAFRNYKRLGIVGTQTEVGETMKLTDDFIRAETDGRGSELVGKAYKKLDNASSSGIRGLKKTYGKIQDTYIAEDDFWKIVTFKLERNRHDSILKNLGVNRENYKEMLKENSAKARYFNNIIERKDIADESFDGFLDEISATMVRNQVPNYEYVGRTGKALRASPFGNFIAFPLEIMRTGNNIIEQSIREIKSGIPEIEKLGYRRLFGFGTTIGGLPLALVETYKAKNNVTDEELNALRKFVPEWSKNSTLIPVSRDENGYLKYIDFSYTNAYDFLLRPYRAVLNGITQENNSEESLKALLAGGMQDGVSELMQPFASESIFTEALIDSTIRRGVGKNGNRVWSESDAPMSKIAKGVFHIGESFLPTGSIKQASRIGKALREDTDNYGRSFELEDEIKGIFGYRPQKSDPEKALTYMTTRFGRELKKDENLFTAPLLRGGRVSPEDIVTSYKYSESRRFQTLKEMYQNIDAAKTLGVPNYKIRSKISRRGLSKQVASDLMLGFYTPKKPSDFFKKRIGEINRDLNQKEGQSITNPYLEALPDIMDITNRNRRLSLLSDEIDMFSAEDLQPDVLLNNQTSSISNSNPVINSQITGTPISPNSFAQQVNNNYNSLSTVDKINAFKQQR